MTLGNDGGFRDTAGRRHLGLHRDAKSGAEWLRLEAAIFEQAWQDELVLSAANTAFGVLRAAPGLAQLVVLTRRMLDSTSRLIAGLLANAHNSTVACKAGCDHCCHVIVGVTAPEALIIFEPLRLSRSPEALARLTSHIVEFDERARGLSSKERFSPAFPCVFLEAGQCSIYEVRPLACRGMNSLDATECETRLRDPQARATFAEKGGGRLFVEPIQAFRAVSAGLQLALSELYGLDMRPFELSAIMLLLLQGGQPLAEAWMAKQRPFDAALCRPQ